MCKFFSLVVTKCKIYYDIKNHSHSYIINKFGIDDTWDIDIVKIEVVPSDWEKMIFDKIVIDQDVVPEWFNLECERDAIMKIVDSHTLNMTIDEKCIAFVTNYGYAVEYLTEVQRTPAVCLAAVTNDGYAVIHLTEAQRTPAVCLAAVTTCGNAVIYLTEAQRTPAVCLAAVTNYGYTVIHLTEAQRTPAVCLAAVTNYGNAVVHLTEAQKEGLKGIKK